MTDPALEDLRRRAGLFDRLDEFAARYDGEIAIALMLKRGEWSVMMNFGREAPDSPMWGGSALGAADTLEDALTQALEEVRA